MHGAASDASHASDAPTHPAYARCIVFYDAPGHLFTATYIYLRFWCRQKNTAGRKEGGSDVDG